METVNVRLSQGDPEPKPQVVVQEPEQPKRFDPEIPQEHSKLLGAIWAILSLPFRLLGSGSGARKERSFADPFKGLRGAYATLSQPFRFVISPVGWWNVRQARLLFVRNHALFIGGGKTIYLWPFILCNFLLGGLGWFNVGDPVIMGAIFVLVLDLTIATVCEDISQREAGLFFGVLGGCLVAFVSLYVTGIIQPGRTLLWVLETFHPGLEFGTHLLIAVTLLAFWIQKLLVSLKTDSLEVRGGNFAPRMIHNAGLFKGDEVRFHALIHDWMEWFMCHSRNIYLIRTQSTARTEEEIMRDSVYALENVPSGGWVKLAIERYHSAEHVTAG